MVAAGSMETTRDNTAGITISYVRLQSVGRVVGGEVIGSVKSSKVDCVVPPTRLSSVNELGVSVVDAVSVTTTHGLLTVKLKFASFSI